MDIDPALARTFNAALLAILLILCACLVAVFASPSSAYARADRFSLRMRLPYASATTRDSVARRGRVGSLATAITMLVTALMVAPLLLTPVGTSTALPFVVIAPMLVATGFVSAVVSVRERLFHPAPDAPRIARARALRAGDYLGPFRLLLPWLLALAATLALAALSTRWVIDSSRVDGPLAGAAILAAVIAATAFTALGPVERLVLAQPQPATDTLELAWDDAFRTTALGALRLSAALSAWLACSLALGALWLGGDGMLSTFATQVPTWGVIALTFVYPSTGLRLRAGLYPDWLRRSVTVGGAA